MNEANIARFFSTLREKKITAHELFDDEDFLTDIVYYSKRIDHVASKYSAYSEADRKVIFNNLVMLMPLSNKITEAILTEQSSNTTELQNAYSNIYSTTSHILRFLNKVSKELGGSTTKALSESIDKVTKIERTIEQHDTSIKELQKKSQQFNDLTTKKNKLESSIKKLEGEATEENLKDRIKDLKEKEALCKKIVADMVQHKSDDDKLNSFLGQLPKILLKDESDNA